MKNKLLLKRFPGSSGIKSDINTLNIMEAWLRWYYDFFVKAFHINDATTEKYSRVMVSSKIGPNVDARYLNETHEAERQIVRNIAEHYFQILSNIVPYTREVFCEWLLETNDGTYIRDLFITAPRLITMMSIPETHYQYDDYLYLYRKLRTNDSLPLKYLTYRDHRGKQHLNTEQICNLALACPVESLNWNLLFQLSHESLVTLLHDREGHHDAIADIFKEGGHESVYTKAYKVYNRNKDVVGERETVKHAYENRAYFVKTIAEKYVYTGEELIYLMHKYNDLMDIVPLDNIDPESLLALYKRYPYILDDIQKEKLSREQLMLLVGAVDGIEEKFGKDWIREQMVCWLADNYPGCLKGLFYTAPGDPEQLKIF